MANKNDISAFKNIKSKKVLQKDAAKPKTVKKPAERKGRIGRPPKQPEAKETHRVQFQLTQSEADIISDKANGMPVNLYIKTFLRRNTDLFK